MRAQKYTVPFFKLLDEIVNQQDYVFEDRSILVRLSLTNIVERLDVPSHFGYADIKSWVLKPLIKHINETSDLELEILEERRNNRVVEHLVIGITSPNSSPAEILKTTTQFIRKRMISQ